MNSNTDICKIKIIGGSYVNVDRNSIVGYCHNKEHKGCLTVSIMNEHNCTGKNCLYFEKYEQYPYWEKLNHKEFFKQLKKEKLNRQKENLKRHNENIKRKEETIKQYIEQISDELGFTDFKTISVHKNQTEYIVFYISNQNKNDWFNYRSIAFALNKRFNKKFVLKHAKNINGEYETI